MAKRGRKPGSSQPSAAGASSRKADSDTPPLGDYRHAATRKNNPPAKIAAEGTVPAIPRAQYAYNPHLPPVLRFDQAGGSDTLPKLLAEAGRRVLTPDEQRLLAEALRRHEPWLEWTGKREAKSFEVDPVALHIHERVSTQAILKVAARQDVQRSLFADPQQEYHEAVQFYRHDVDWANRLILGDSLAVMSSLARREDLAGKVQMIYLDPPYGIRFKSNFQPRVGSTQVRDSVEDLTREAEMVRAYRDTWHLGIHSYLSYLRDRLIVARELLTDTGHIFVQISDENVHVVRSVLDEVFGRLNQVVTVVVKKKGNQKGGKLEPINDYLLWYARDKTQAQVRPLFLKKFDVSEVPDDFDRVQLRTGEIVAPDGLDDDALQAILNDGGELIYSDQLSSGGEFRTQLYPVEFEGREFRPAEGNSWKHNETDLARVRRAERIFVGKNQIRFRKLLSDFGSAALTNLWTDVAGAKGKVYVVQTNTKVIERCMLMTTDPGDLVLDPTCGSGTTATVAEQWGRRWITIDTSRVAIAIARQRLLTAKYDHYRTRHEGTEARRHEGKDNGHDNPGKGFIYKTVPHITLKSIAQNVALDPIFARHEPVLDQALAACNAALREVTPELRARLAAKLSRKEREAGKRAVTDADRRRWELPDAKSRFEHWTVPFDSDDDWPRELQEAVTAYRAAWRAKMDEVNACIAASAEQEELVDQPEVVRGVTRVSGPFTVEAVQPPEMTLGDNVDPHTGGEGLFAGDPDALPEGFEPRKLRVVEPRPELDTRNVSAYLDQMFRYLKADGVRFLNNKQMRWTRLEPLFEAGTAAAAVGFHAEGRWTPVGDDDPDPDGGSNVGVVFGPQYGPVTVKMIEELIKPAGRRYDHLVIAGFNFTAEAHQMQQENVHPKVKLHFAHIRPDINPAMNGLLKESPQPGSGQLFTVFGLPRVGVRPVAGRDAQGSTRTEYVVEVEGVDIYNPVDNSIASTGAEKVAAWFLDGDFDGRTFCVTQAFFPDRSAWDKLARALNGNGGLIDAERFEAFSGTTSLSFPAGKNRCVAVKVIDPRGNEVMCVERLN